VVEPDDDVDAVPKRPRGKVELKHVDLSYPSWPDIQVFRDLSLRARPGKKLALVGEHEVLLKVGDDTLLHRRFCAALHFCTPRRAPIFARCG